MNIGMPSRFACLKLEDDEEKPKKKGEVKNKHSSSKPVLKKDHLPKQNQPKKVEKADKTEKVTQQQNKNKASNGSAKKKDKKVAATDKQWEEWKEKDRELVNGHFEQDLQSAILLSKLDYEEKKELYDKYKKETEEANKKIEKKKKTKIMSWEQFLAGGLQKAQPNQKHENRLKNEANFFNNIDKEVKSELTKEKNTEKQRKQRENVDIDRIITSAQYQERLDKELKKNSELREQLSRAREEIALVKTRNQTLCAMLSTGEMKDKADVLLELEKLTKIKDDLTDEVSKLHVLLEQERSKVASLSSDSKHKDKKRKKHV